MKIIKKQLGFTFLELLVVVALIAILSMFSYPSYQKYVLRLNRIEVRNTMDMIAQRLEQNFSVTRDFTHYYDPAHPENRTGTEYKDPKDMMIALGYSQPQQVSENKPVYEITLNYITKDETYGPGFYLEAQAVNKQEKDRCTFFYLNHRNVRKAASKYSPTNPYTTSPAADWSDKTKISSRGGYSQECWQS